MPARILLIVMDGLGDRPLRQLEDQTPLEAAEKPNLNRLARKGITGLMSTCGIGVMPGSDVATFAVLGFDPEKVYFGRGPLEAFGAGLSLGSNDVAFRVNFGTVDDKGVIVDRRAGRIASASDFCKELDGIVIDKVKFTLKHTVGHRAVLVMSGKGLSPKVSNSDPKAVGVKPLTVKPLDSSKQAKSTAQALNKFLEKAAMTLAKSRLNSKRISEGLPPANCLLARGAGSPHRLETFEQKFGLKSCCVAGGALYKGVARAVGMKLIENPAFTGKPDTDLNLKLETAVNALKDFDFVFLHIKATDSFAEDGDFQSKKEFIERVDKACRALPELKDTVIAVTADHSTPCSLKKHSADPVPLLVFGPDIRIDPVTNFSERSCAHGAIGRIKGLELVPELINLAGRSKIYGA